MTVRPAAAANQALGAYGEALAARHLSQEKGMVLLDRNWRCDAGEIDLVLRDGRRAGRVRGQDPQQPRRGTRTRRSRRRKVERLHRARHALAAGARRAAAPDLRIDLVAVHAAPARSGRPIDHVRGVGLMPFATAHTVSLHGALGHLIDVQADVSPGQVGTTLVGRPDAVAARGAATGAGWRSSTAELELAGDQADHDPAVAGRPAQARHRTSTSRSRSPCSPPTAGSRGGARAGPCSSASSPSTGGLRSVPGVLPMVLAAAAARHPPGLRARAAGPRGGDGARAWPCFGMRSLAQIVAELRGDEVPEAPPVAAMSGSRLLSWRGQERLDEVDMADLLGHGTTPGTPSRSRPPAATT